MATAQQRLDATAARPRLCVVGPPAPVGGRAGGRRRYGLTVLRWPCFVALIATACARPAPPPPVNRDTPEAVAQDYWELVLGAAPLWATELGDRRFDAALPDLSAEALEATWRRKQELKARLDAINAGFLIGSTLTTARFLATALASDLREEVCQGPLWQLDPFAGIHLLLARLASLQRLDSSSAASAYVSRLSGGQALLEQHTANLRRGLLRGYRAAPEGVAQVLAQVQAMAAEPAERTPLWAAVAAASELSDEERRALRDDVAQVWRQSLQPALRAYAHFLREAYRAPPPRPADANNQNPHWPACYAALVENFAGPGATAAALHAAGMRDLEAQEASLQGAAEAAGFADAQDLLQHSRAAKAAWPTEPRALLSGATAALGRARAALPRAFGHDPNVGLSVIAMEPFLAASGGPALYAPAALDGRHPAVLRINTRASETRLLADLEALVFQEALPGRHLLMGWAQGLADLPPLRRLSGQVTFVEGWSLYAQLLADELGLYSGPAARFGMLRAQVRRTAVLVVDTGLHALGWSRAQAVSFLTEHAGLPAPLVEQEVDRVLLRPAEALAPVAGRLELQKLRRQAEAKKQGAFTLEAFHERVLGQGAVPIPVLRDAVGAWLGG